MPMGEMSCVNKVLVVVLGLVQLSQGDIIELKKFHPEPSNYFELNFDHKVTANDGVSSPREALHSVTKRQGSSGQPRIDGEHMFGDGYLRGRVYYSRNNSDVIVVLTYNLRNDIPYQSNLYRSTNYGHNFTNINAMVKNSVLYQTFFVSGVNKNLLMFAHANRPQIFISFDEGATFTLRNLVPNTLNPRTIKYHPKRDGLMLILDEDSSLYVTMDYGASWAQVAANVDAFQWGDEKWDTSDQILYYTTQDPENVNQTLNLYTSDYPYTTTTKFDTNLGDHDGFLLVGRYIFAQRTDDGVIGLHVSADRKPFQKALIPTPSAHQRYLVAHINDMQALVVVEHEGGFYNLYLSDESGVYFSLSLSDIVVETPRQQTQIDLELIDGVNGTLIANQYAREDPSRQASLIRTLISLDNGGFWEVLIPPDEDLNGDTINCEPPDCSLHLHMDTSDYARLGVYSTDSAPGIIVAHGNTGRVLSVNPDLYISRDGGVSWEETLAGSWGVNLADHGGLIVAAKDYHQEQSTELMYSCDEGYNWRNFTFIDTDFTVFGVITEPGHHTTIVSLYGGPWGPGSTFRWTVVTVDFAGIFSRSCEDEDYYDWMPWDVRSDSDCILGSTVTIERRKPQVCCLNGREYDREFNFTICECTSEDFECDYGYARPSFDLNAPCMRDAVVTLADPCADGKAETYMASTGYRKVAGDVCMGGEASLFNAFEAPCCENSTLPPTPHIPTLPPSSSSAPNPTTTPDIPTVPSSSSSTPNPTTTPHIPTVPPSSSSTPNPTTTPHIPTVPPSSSSTPNPTTTPDIPTVPPSSSSSSTPNPTTTPDIPTVPPSSSSTLNPTTTPDIPTVPPSSSSTPNPTTTPDIPTVPPSSSSAPNPTTTLDIPTVPPSSSSSSTPNPTTNPPGGAQKGSNDGTSRGVNIVLGVFLTLACFAAVALLFLFIGLTFKYKGLRKKYIRVMTAGEPDLQRYTASSGRENSPDAHTPVFEDDDDVPLVPLA